MIKIPEGSSVSQEIIKMVKKELTKRCKFKEIIESVHEYRDAEKYEYSGECYEGGF
jgi:hypothetical protein